MKIVTYSLFVSGPRERTSYHDELLYSVKSLRLYNKSVSVHVFLYGEHPPGFTQELEEQAVDVHQMGSYVDAIRRIHARAFHTLSVYPVLHKWLNFGELERLAPTQILQADCDTFFFDDVDALFARYSDRHFYAREEPASKASHYGYDSTYLDESVLAAIAQSEGAGWVNPYNIGVCVLNHGIWSEIAKRVEQWLREGDVFVFFDNDTKVRAPYDARNLTRMLEGKSLVRPPAKLRKVTEEPRTSWDAWPKSGRS